MSVLQLPAELVSLLHAAVAVLLLGLSLVALPLAYRRAWRLWRAEEPLQERWSAAALVVAAVLRWAVAPLWLTMVFIGYRMTETAIQLVPVNHYGIGASALYHMAFAMLPLDHRSLMAVNSLVGVLALPLHAALALQLLGSKVRAVRFLWLLAATPLLIQLDNSEANHVPTLWWLSGGLLLWLEFAQTRSRLALSGSLVLLVLAMTSRVEMVLLAPLLAYLALWTVRGERPRALGRPTLPTALLWLGTGTLLVPQLINLMQAGLPLLPEPAALVGRLGIALTLSNVLLRPSLFPLGILLVALPALRERKLWPLAAMAVVCVLAVAPDVDRGNMARVQAPAALFVCMLAAAGLDRLVQSRMGSVVGRSRVALATWAAMAVSAAFTVPFLWAPSNERAEELFLRDALTHLPAGPYTLIRLSTEDRVPKQVGRESTTQLHFPDYLVKPPVGQARLSSVAAWLERPDPGHPTYFFAGVRCFAAWRPDGQPPPAGLNEHPACRQLRKSAKLVPVFQRTVPNHGDVWLNNYGDAAELPLALYKVEAR